MTTSASSPPTSPTTLGPRPSNPNEEVSKNLQETLEKERQQHGIYESVIRDPLKAHKWNLGQEKINFQEIYHAKYLYDDQSGLSQQIDNSDSTANSTCIRMSPIPKGFYEQEMYDFFSQIAPIRRMRIKRDPKNGLIVKGQAYALVDFKDAQSAQMIADEIPMLNVRGELVTLEMYRGKRQQMEKFFSELSPEEYAAQILKNSAAQGETWSKRRRQIIPQLAFAAYRVVPQYTVYLREKQAEEKNQRLRERLAKHDLSYEYEPIEVDTAAAPIVDKKVSQQKKQAPPSAGTQKKAAAQPKKLQDKKRKRNDQKESATKKRSKKSKQ